MYGTGGLYDASNLMDRDLVVVTLNYRLGPLGKFSNANIVKSTDTGSFRQRSWSPSQNTEIGHHYTLITAYGPHLMDTISHNPIFSP